MTRKKIQITIDQKTVSAEEGESIIAVTDRHGVYIPRFCYHEKLSVAANCRMCLVEVEGAPKTLPACATPVRDGMRVKTRSAQTRASQRAVMEFLLINHPLDCPICDQGGECELQDLAMGYGRSISRYNQGKRTVVDKDIGPLIATDLTRCIHCTRCVRFGEEVAGMPELGLNGRGESSHIRSFLSQGVRSELSGNMIDLCPVGALTSKPYRYQGRSWGFTQHPVIMRHDGVGSHAFAHVHGGEYGHDKQVMRILPKPHDAINETWLSDTDRFSYLGLNHPQRLLKPAIKQDGQWQTVNWSTALAFVVQRLKKTVAEQGPDQVAGWMHPSASMEEGWVFQELFRQLGVRHIDHRIHQMHADDQGLDLGVPMLPVRLIELHKFDQLVIFGGDFRQDTPLLNHWIRQAAQQGTAVHHIHGYQLDTNFKTASQAVCTPKHWLLIAQMLVQGLAHTADHTQNQSDAQAALLQQMMPILKGLNTAKHTMIVMGQSLMNHPDFPKIQALLSQYAQGSEKTVQLGYVSDGGNSAGLTAIGVTPYRNMHHQASEAGLNVLASIRKPLSFYWLHHIDPDLDLPMGQAAQSALSQAFTVICHSYDRPQIRQVADVLLPVASCLESSGTVMNLEGCAQWSQAALMPPEQARPSWKVYTAVMQQLDPTAKCYTALDEVTQAMGTAQPKVLYRNGPVPASDPISSSHPNQPTIEQLGCWPGAKMDAVVRHAQALQTQLGPFQARMHPSTAQTLHPGSQKSIQVRVKGQAETFKVDLDDRVAQNTLVFHMGFETSMALQASFGTVQLERAD